MNSHVSAILLGVRDMERSKRFYADGLGWKVKQDFKISVFFVPHGGSMVGFYGRDGLAESDDTGQDGPQKRFRITPQGTEALAAWLRTPPDLTSPPRDELVMKVLVAARVPGTDAHEVIQAHRLYLVELMQQWTRLKEGEARDDLGLALVVDAELFRLDAVTRWLDAADTRLKRAAAEPAPEPAPGPAPVPQLRRLGARR